MYDELLDIVDDAGRVERRVSKRLAHEHGLLHRTSIGYLIDGDTWVLVRQASTRQDAGQLVAPIGGHVRSGESAAGALLREAREEIGTDRIQFEHMGDAIFRRHVLDRDENHLFSVFRCQTNDALRLGDESVSIQSFAERELRTAIAQSPSQFGLAFFFAVERFFPQILPMRWASLTNCSGRNPSHSIFDAGMHLAKCGNN